MFGAAVSPGTLIVENRMVGFAAHCMTALAYLASVESDALIGAVLTIEIPRDSTHAESSAFSGMRMN